MIKILWLLESKINSDFINKISNEIATFVNNMRTEVKVLADNT